MNSYDQNHPFYKSIKAGIDNGLKINKGDKYNCQVNVFDGEINTVRSRIDVLDAYFKFFEDY